jgi:quercetin dioxygenase-like cupin family protein
MFKNSLKVAPIVLAALTFSGQAPLANQAAAPQAPTVVRKVMLQQDLASMPGYAAALVSVEIPVGGREGRHMHPGTLVAYVQQGTLTLDHEGKPTATLQVGDTFSVEPGKVHEGMNKGTVPVKLVATFVFEKSKPMTTQVP